MANRPLEHWALPRLQQLLPLDEDGAKQVIQYADTLPKDAAAEHLKNLLGDDAKALEFISSFNLRRQNAPLTAQSQPTKQDNERNAASASDSGISSLAARAGRSGKKKANIHALPARQLDGHGDVGGAYQKRLDGEEYVPKAMRSRQTHKEHVAEKPALREQPPDATQMPLITDDASATSKPITSKLPPSAAGSLVSDSLSPNKKPASALSSRTSSPAPKTKVNISGGTAMQGASTTLSDLDAAIRSLEIQTNPALSVTSAADNEKRKCNCMATRHPLLDIAPNCMDCGKIICVKEGLGPCTFCGSPLLSGDEIAKVLRVLKDERGDEKMRVNNAAHRKADVAQGKPRVLTGRAFLAQPQPSSARSSPLSSMPGTPAGSDDEASSKAKAHRDKLLDFQTNNARRTQIHDEAADYEVPTAGTSMWASPVERAQQLKKQQKVLREMQWNMKPEYEKRKVVASLDLKGGKVVRKMAAVDTPNFDLGDESDGDGAGQNSASQANVSGMGAFSNNPLAAGLIRPKMREQKGKDAVTEKKHTWRRVQMDEDDNEAWILDGGIYGARVSQDRVLDDGEHDFG